VRRLCAIQRTAPHLVRLGQILVDRGDLDEALLHLVDALSIDPADANAHLAIGQILLARGDYRAGWFEYEWRGRLPQARAAMPRMIAPQWNGMALPNGRVLLIGDQGFGDIIFFARYVTAVAERCREVVVACSQKLRPLVERIPGVWKCIDS